MPKINMKPLSINVAFFGRKIKTKEYRLYEQSCLYLLPKIEIPDGKLEIDFEFGFSSSGSDYDNAIKPFQDILQKKYGFNDSKIYKSTILKTIVKKGEEFIKFEIKAM
jgi:Holliday junction resolvase RusA-like endonuclease